MNSKLLASLSIALMATSLLNGQPAEAGEWKRSVNNRQQRQSNRIGQGMLNGSLTGRETRRLANQQWALNKKEARFRASGDGLTMNERARLQHQQNQLSKNIYTQKHDGQDRIPGNGPNHPVGGNPAYRPNNQLFDVNQTQRNQQERIYNGIQNGGLTQKEAVRLDNQQDRLENREARMRQDGLTLQERIKLDNQQDRLSRQIYQQKHDRQDLN